jgi:predicted GTPase
MEPLRRIELVDTPGFNAPDTSHSRLARQALADAHVALWLLDATQPLKDTERSVLEEIAGLGVPLVVLVNKTDRLHGEKARHAVLEHVSRELLVAGLVVESSPVAFSARQSMQGHRGDLTAREASNWGEVEALVERLLVSRSVALRERALRRRAIRIARQLATVARERETRRLTALRTAAESRRAALALVASVRAARRDLADALGPVVEQAQLELVRDMRPLQGAWDAGDRFLTVRARGTVGRRVGEAAVDFCRERLGDLPEAAARRYRVQVELAASVAAPWLLAEALQALGEGAARERSEPRISAASRLIRAAIDELAAAAEEVALGIVEPARDRAGARVMDFVAALTTTLES